MKRIFLAALLALPLFAGTGCNNNDNNGDAVTGCIVGTWKTSVNATGTPCDMIIEYKGNGTGTSKILDCSDYCNQVGQGTNANLNYHTFNYTISGNQVTQVVQGQIIVCGTPQGANNISTNSTFNCSGNTLTFSSQGGGTVTLTRM